MAAQETIARCDARLASRQCGLASATWLTPTLVDPCRDVVRIEPEEVTPLDERDPALSDQPTHMPNGDPEVFSDAADVE